MKITKDFTYKRFKACEDYQAGDLILQDDDVNKKITDTRLVDKGIFCTVDDPIKKGDYGYCRFEGIIKVNYETN